MQNLKNGNKTTKIRQKQKIKQKESNNKEAK